MYERLSLSDQSLISSYADHIQRYQFALPYCKGKRVLDTGCGIGYGSHYLATHGAARVVAVDISEEALSEARKFYIASNLRFERQNAEELQGVAELSSGVDVVVNFENIEHLHDPEALLRGVRSVLPGREGVLITSTPNGEVSDLDEHGKLRNLYHVKEFTRHEFSELLGHYFSNIEFYGQWLTPDGKLRQLRARELFEQLCEAYYNPAARAGRASKRMFGRPVARPPQFTASADCFSGDYVIGPLDTTFFRWPPSVLVAVCF